MASTSSFDISTGADLQEVDNAVNQAIKEVGSRYDFRGTKCTIEFDRDAAVINLHADDDFRMNALLDVVRGKLIKRGVPVKNLKIGDRVAATGTSVRLALTLAQGIPAEVAKKIQKAIREQKFKKTQASIQGDELRVSAPSKDTLQEVIAFLRESDFEVELQFGNFR